MKGFKINPREVTTILTLVVALIGILAMREGCARGVGNLFKAFDGPPDAAGFRDPDGR